MGRSFFLALSFVLLAVQLRGAPPQEAAAALRNELEPLAKWCAENGLLREQHRCCAILIHFVPDHAEARRVLQFSRKKDGTWERPKSYSEPRTTKDKLLPEFQQRFDALAGAFRTAVRAELAKEPAGSPQRARLIADWLAVLPEDEEARAAAGEARHEGRWLPREIVKGSKRGEVLRGFGAESLKAAEKPEKSEPTEAEKAWGLPWTACVQTRAVRVLATFPEEEAARTARYTLCAAETFRRTFAVATELAPRYTLVLMQPPQRQMLLGKLTFPTPAERKYTEALMSFWIPNSTAVAVADAAPSIRLEWCVRQTIADLLRTEFGITVSRGALFEGLGLYLTWLVTGTRTTIFVAPEGRYAGSQKPLGERLRDPATNWLTEAEKLMGKGPWLDGLLRKELRSMNSEDVVLAFAFVQWLLEGWPEAAPGFLKAAGAGGTPEKILPASFPADVLGVEARVRRWILEKL